MKRKLKCKSSKYVLPSNRTLDILKVGVGTHIWMYVRKKDFHISYTWYKSLEGGILLALTLFILEYLCTFSTATKYLASYLYCLWKENACFSTKIRVIIQSFFQDIKFKINQELRSFEMFKLFSGSDNEFRSLISWITNFG